jgi:hypothetical protein
LIIGEDPAVNTLLANLFFVSHALVNISFPLLLICHFSPVLASGFLISRNSVPASLANFIPKLQNGQNFVCVLNKDSGL